VRDAQRRLSENEGAAVELHKRALAAEQALLVSLFVSQKHRLDPSSLKATEQAEAVAASTAAKHQKEV